MKQTAKSERHFVLDGQYEALFRANGIQVEEALRKADIPEDIFRLCWDTERSILSNARSASGPA